MFRSVVVGLLASSIVVMAGCGDDEDSVCDAIAEACHESTSADGIACHHLAEDANTSEAECQDLEQACLDACE